MLDPRLRGNDGKVIVFMNRALNSWVTRALFCGALFFSPAGMSAKDEKVSLNFVDANIEEVVKAISLITGRNFLVDPRVKGTINIISSTPVAAPLAYDILLSALRMQGFAAVESGGVTKVMPEADAKLHIGASIDQRGGGDKLVTRVYVLKYESAAQLVSVLRPLIAPNNIIVAYPSSNTLVITDYASNLKRLEQIIKTIDQPNVEAPVIIPLKHASAMEVAQTITRLMQDGGAPGGSGDSSTRFVLMADARTNSLLLRTDNPARLERVRELAEKLDIETGAPGNIRVVYLKNAEAVKMAQTLRAVMSGDVSMAAAPAGGAGPAGGGIIQADAATNALIITASSATYNNLRAVIEMLDVRRAQVFVEALIVEVAAGKAAEFGVQWLAGGGNATGTQVAGGTNFGGTGTNIIGVVTAGIAMKSPMVANPLAMTNPAAAIGTGLNIGLLRGQNLGALARALETEANANILSTPNLLTLDNEEAEIAVGVDVPFITGTKSGTGAGDPTVNTIERKNVGLTLRITPQILEGGVVKLEVFQEVSSLLTQTVNNAAGPLTNQRTIKSTVLVDEGQIVVLGGLIQDSVSSSEERVPVLGSIPWIGALFRYEKRERSKTNLMVFIRPYIMRTAAASQGLTQDRYEYLRGEQEQGQLSPRVILPDMPAPLIPPLDLQQELPLPSSPADSSAPVATQP